MAQPEQSKPSGWFIDSNVLEPLSAMLCSRSAFAVARRRSSRRRGIVRDEHRPFGHFMIRNVGLRGRGEDPNLEPYGGHRLDAKRSAKGAGYSSREREPFRWNRFLHD